MNDTRSTPRCWACLNFEAPNDAEPCSSCTDESAFVDARAECKRLRELLAEAREDVSAELDRCRELAGYPSTDRRLAAQTDLLSRVDAAIGSTT